MSILTLTYVMFRAIRPSHVGNLNEGSKCKVQSAKCIGTISCDRKAISRGNLSVGIIDLAIACSAVCSYVMTAKHTVKVLDISMFR